MAHLRLFLMIFFWPLLTQAATPSIAILKIDTAITPVSADYFVRGLQQAAARQASLVILQIDTPGDLDSAMRDMIKEILASPIPVAGFISPRGAPVGSAGTYILYACHFAAMAEGTSLGAATPIAMGSGRTTPAPMNADSKIWPQGKPGSASPSPTHQHAASAQQVEDASAYLRSLAQLRGRNVEWAEHAVREAASLSAKEALEAKVIDLIAVDVPDLLKQLHGKKTSIAGVDRSLNTAGATTFVIEADWRTRLLGVITNPGIALILLMLGIYGLIFEFSNPGLALPGVVGGICLLLALYGFQLLPLSYTGLGLIILGLALMLAEAFIPSFGILGLGGVLAFILGGAILIDSDIPGYGISLHLILPLSVASALLTFFSLAMAIRARIQPVVSGGEAIIGASGKVLANCVNNGWAHIHGKNWRITCQQPLTQGQKIRVSAIHGLTLDVEPQCKDDKS